MRGTTQVGADLRSRCLSAARAISESARPFDAGALAYVAGVHVHAAQAWLHWAWGHGVVHTAPENLYRLDAAFGGSRGTWRSPDADEEAAREAADPRTYPEVREHVFSDPEAREGYDKEMAEIQAWEGMCLEET